MFENLDRMRSRVDAACRRLEPEATAVDPSTTQTSMALSLRRIADALERLAAPAEAPEKPQGALPAADPAGAGGLPPAVPGEPENGLPDLEWPGSLPELGPVPGLLAAILSHHGQAPWERAGTEETPVRFAKAMQFWLGGYKQDPKAVLKLFEDGAEHYDEMVFQGCVPVYSLCEHHLAPFFGVAHVAYIPNKRIVGLSKISRLIEVFARRLQVQERLSAQIADALTEHLDPLGVGVVLRCRHLCMESRGIQKSGTMTITSALRGALRKNPETRAEFMHLVALAEQGGRPL